MRLGLIFALINIVGIEFLINFGGLGQLINDLAERYDLAGTYAAICFVILVSVLFFMVIGKGRAMAETGRLSAGGGGRAGDQSGDACCASPSSWRCWRRGSCSPHSGWLYRDVVPSLLSIGRAMASLLADRDYYFNLGVTAGEIGAALAIGGCRGLAVGLAARRQSLPVEGLRALSLLSRADAEDHLLPGHDHVVRRRARNRRSRSARCRASFPSR